MDTQADLLIQPKSLAFQLAMEKISWCRTLSDFMVVADSFLIHEMSDVEIKELMSVYISMRKGIFKKSEFSFRDWSAPKNARTSVASNHGDIAVVSLSSIPSCGQCAHFTPDTINPVGGIGSCKKHRSSLGKGLLPRYPMQKPKGPECLS